MASQLQLEGLSLRRDTTGTVHVSGGSALIVNSDFHDDMDDGPVVFCLHSDGDCCPSESAEPTAQYGSWFLMLASPDSGRFKG